MARKFTVTLTSGTNTGPYNIYYNSVSTSTLADLFGTTNKAENLTLSQVQSGVVIEVPNSATSIIFFNTDPDVATDCATNQEVYSLSELEPTATPTPTSTDIPDSPTPVPTETPTPTPTDTPIPTYTPVPTSTETPTPTPTATDVPELCVGIEFNGKEGTPGSEVTYEGCDGNTYTLSVPGGDSVEPPRCVRNNSWSYSNPSNMDPESLIPFSPCGDEGPTPTPEPTPTATVPTNTKVPSPTDSYVSVTLCSNGSNYIIDENVVCDGYNTGLATVSLEPGDVIYVSIGDDSCGDAVSCAEVGQPVMADNPTAVWRYTGSNTMFSECSSCYTP